MGEIEKLKFDDYYSSLKQRLGRRGDHLYKGSSGKYVCPLHADVKPSMGVLQGKDGRDICNCFGCGEKGDLIKVHLLCEKRYFNRNIDRVTSLRELCLMFNKDYEKALSEEENLTTTKEECLDQVLLEESREQRMDLPEFKRKWKQGILENRSPVFLNSVLMERIREIKNVK